MKRYILAIFITLFSCAQYAECRLVTKEEWNAQETAEQNAVHDALSNFVSQKYYYDQLNNNLKKKIRTFLIDNNIIDTLQNLSVTTNDLNDPFIRQKLKVDRSLTRSLGTTDGATLQIANNLLDSIINGIITIESLPEGHSRRPQGLKDNTQLFLRKVKDAFSLTQDSTTFDFVELEY